MQMSHKCGHHVAINIDSTVCAPELSKRQPCSSASPGQLCLPDVWLLDPDLIPSQFAMQTWIRMFRED